ncbi:hypothetical protein SprV_0602145400 [Sparganum proliferum]
MTTVFSDQAEVRAGGGEGIHTSLHVSSSSCIGGAVVDEEKFVDGGYGYTRLEVHPPLFEKVAARLVSDADAEGRSSR